MYGIGLAVEKQVALPKVKSVADAKMRTGATSVAGEIDAYLPTILAAAGLGLWRFHPVPGHFTLDATAALILHGREDGPEELDAFLNRFHPDDRQGMALRLELCAEAGAPLTCSCRIVQPDGTAAWARMTASHIRATSGESVIAGTIQMIAGQKATEEALRTSEARLATIFDQTMVGLMHRDADLNVIMVNDRYCEIVGRSSAELCGLPMQAFTHPDDVAWNIELFDTHALTGEPFMTEKRYVRPDGTVVWCEINVSFVPDPTGRASTIVVAHDITDRKAAEKERQRTNDLLQFSLDGAGAGTWEVDLAGGLLRLSPAARRIYGFPQDHSGELKREDWAALVDPDSLKNMQESFRLFCSSQEPSSMEFKIHGVDGRERWLRALGRADFDQCGCPVRIGGLVYDDSERKRAEEEMRASEAHLRLVQEAALIGTFVVNPDGSATGSQQFFRNLGLPEDTNIISRADRLAILHPEDRERVVQKISAAIETNQRLDIEYRIVLPGRDEVRWGFARMAPERDTDGRLLGAHLDITEAKAAAEHIRRAASHDGLTGLPNRSHFHERLENALKAAAATGETLGLLALDVDDFKGVNDALGHDAGDALLKIIAQRLKTILKEQDVVARLGGDEFAIIVSGVHAERDILQTASAVVQCLKEPFMHRGCIVDFRMSIGAATYPLHGGSADTLLKNANIARYATKKEGRSRALLFQPSMRSEIDQRTAMIGFATNALASDDISPFYQPKICLTTGAIHGFEALLRWRDAAKNIQSPLAISAAFEDLKVAQAISERMQDRVIADMRRWLDAGINFGHVALNAAAAEFRQNDFAERLLGNLSAAKVPAHFLELEVTETVFLGRGAEYVERALKLLNSHGVRIALDDFGTGYASLSHLKQFPVDVIKIDQSFVRDLADTPDDAAIVRALIGLGKSLSIRIVAEGIEQSSQAALLSKWGCDYGQGYLFSKAVPSARVPQMLAACQEGSASRQKTA